MASVGPVETGHRRARAPDGALGAVVLGMGRSGTSAITRTFAAAGFHAGADSQLLPSDNSNPVGYWERTAVLGVNEEILGRLGASWFTPPTPAEQEQARSWAVPMLRELLERLLTDAGDAPIVVKDPRIGVMLGLWGELIDETLHPVLAVRHPVEIARSLAARDGTPTAFTLASWELHMRAVLEHLRGRLVTVAPYGALVESAELARAVVAGVVTQLEPAMAQRIDVDASCRAVERRFRHHNAESFDEAAFLTPRQSALWEMLGALSPGNHTLAVPAELTWVDPVAVGLVRAEADRLHQLRCVAELRERVVAEESTLATQRQRAEDAERALREAANELAAERSRADTAVAAQARAEHWLRELESSTTWRLTEPARRAVRIARRLTARRHGHA